MDKVPQVNPITGSILATKASSQAYRDNYDAIFKKKDDIDTQIKEDSTEDNNLE